MVKTIAISAVLLAVLILTTSGKPKKTDMSDTGGAASDVVAAVLYAYGLEEDLWENESGIKSKEDVFTLFRKGFGEEVARDLSEYYWMEGEDPDGERFAVLRSGDPIFFPPDSIEVLKRSDDKAEALLRYSKSEEGPITYRAHSVKVILKKEGNVWKVSEADSGWF